jgi:EmrB/QacA subfamily drug resistance transporter
VARSSVVLATCCASVAVVVMDISIVNVALPSMRRDLGASVSGLRWTVDAYTLVLAGFLVLAGSTADRVGRRRVFQLGLAVFGVGSLSCALAAGVGWLVAARVLQAVGGTMLNPVAMSIVAATYPEPAARARAIGVFGGVTGLSLGLGPVLGGVLVEALSWRAVFWVNVPVVAAALVCTVLFVPESRAARARRPDPVGQLLVALLLGSLAYALIESRPLVLGVAVLALAALVRYEPRRVEPLLEPRLFRAVPFSAAIAMAVCALCAFGAFLFTTTLHLQEDRGYSPLRAGLALAPVGAAVVVLSPVAGRVVAARGPRLPLLVSGAAFVLAGATSPHPVSYLFVGVAIGTVNPPVTNSAVAGMPASMSGLAASLASAGRQTGMTLGVALGGASTVSTGWLIGGLGAAIVLLGVVSTTGRVARQDGAQAG